MQNGWVGVEVGPSRNGRAVGSTVPRASAPGEGGWESGMHRL